MRARIRRSAGILNKHTHGLRFDASGRNDEDQSMCKMIFLAHLPLLRIAKEEVPFAGGSLWRLPFDVYNELSLGAFQDHERAYTGTAPVFYRVDADLESALVRPGAAVAGGAAELKVPSNDWGFISQLGLDFVLRFQGNLVERARAALLLAVPGCSIPDSRLSVTFVRLAEAEGFQLGDNLVRTIRVEGDADQEYLFLKETAGPPVSVELIEDAENCLAIVDGLAQQPELLATMRAMLGTTAPMLSPTDQLVLTVRAIEALLLPEIASGLGRMFARRVSSLLAVDEANREVLRGVARTLYDARSASLHGEAPRSAEEAEAAAAQAHAQQLLAAAIRRLAERCKVVSVRDQRRALDRGEADYNRGGTALPLAAPPALRKPERMLRPYSPVVATSSSAVDMGCKSGTVSWSPLIGLEATVEGALARGDDGVAIMSLSGEEMVSLEERDTARDFIAELRVTAKPAAVVMTGARGQELETTMEGLAPLLRRRDLATLALRLAGFSEFCDPELLGVFVYQGSTRTRFPSVLRQTIEQKMRQPAKEKFAESDLEVVGRLLHLLTEYDKAARHPQIDQVLRLFRHGFDREFLPEIARASLLLSALEGMLGRFRKPQELEQLVARVVRGSFPEAAKWFEERGRRFRNSIAHGLWPAAEQDPQPMERLIEVLRGLIPEFVRAWLKRPQRGSCSPLRAFLESVSQKEGA